MFAVVWPPTVTSTYRDLVEPDPTASPGHSGPGVAALLAAGSGSRFDGPTHKLLAPLDGQPVWHHALQHACSAGYDLVIVVEGAIGLGPVPVLPAGSSPVMIVPNPDWADGQATSLRVAVDAATTHGARHLTIGRPSNDRAGLAALCGVFESGGFACGISDDIRRDTWAKLSVNVAVNLPSALTGAKLFELVRDPLTFETMARTLAEMRGVGAKLGIDPGVVALDVFRDRKSTRLNSSHSQQSRMPSSA